LAHNQNTNKQLQSKHVPAVEVKESSGSSSETISTLPTAEEQTPTLSLQSSNLSAEDLSKADIEPKAETMEVHKHPHHVMHKKKWHEYFLEFFMLFLAVFLGFLAENMREHFVDIRKEKEYMHSLVNDLRADVQDIEGNIQLGAMVTEKLDSLVYLLNYKNPDKNTQDFYRLAVVAGRIVQVRFEDRTSSQLKNSGSLRLVRNSGLSDSIRGYWGQIKINEQIASRMGDLQSKSGDLAMQILSNKYYVLNNSANPFEGRRVKDDAKLLNNDPKLLAQFANFANNRLIVLYIYLMNLRYTKAMASRLIAFIKKEYHFADD